MTIKPEIVKLIHNDVTMNQCHLLAQASGCSYTEMLELMVEALCDEKGKASAEALRRAITESPITCHAGRPTT